MDCEGLNLLSLDQPRETVAVMAAEGTLDLEHVKKWAARELLTSRKAKWAVLSVEKEK